jgi:hypothetical protein
VLGHYAADDSRVAAAVPELADQYPAADGSFGDHIPDRGAWVFNEATPEYSAQAAAIQGARYHPP